MDEENRFSTALDSCLSAIETGKDIEEALAVFPDLANRLRPELQTVIWLQKRKEAVQSANFNPSLSRPRLVYALRQIKTSKIVLFPWSSIRSWLAQAAVLGLMLLMFFQLSLSLVRAAMVAIPGDLLYPIKQAEEQARLAVTTDKIQRASVYIDIAHQRLSEITDLFIENRYQYLESTNTNLRQAANNALAILNSPEIRTSSKAADLTVEVEKTLDNRQAALTALYGSLPENVRADISELLVP